MILATAYDEHATKEESRRDSKTRLLNQKAWMQEARWAMNYQKEGESQAVLILDLDLFKGVNDNEALGHAAGDDVLRVIAQILKKESRGTDRAGYVGGRMGGDEFGVMLRLEPPKPPTPNEKRRTDMDPDKRVLSYIARIKQEFHNYTEQPFSRGGQTLQELVPGLGVSAGYALLTPEKSLETALREADEDLLSKKRARGVEVRNQHTAFYNMSAMLDDPPPGPGPTPDHLL